MATTTMKRDSMDATAPDDLPAKLAATTINDASPKHTPSNAFRANLSALPTPILHRIFSHLLDTELVNQASTTNVSYTHTLSSTNGLLSFRPSRPPFPVCTSLFYVSKELGKKARQYFYAKNLFVRFTVYTSDARHAKSMLTDSGLLFTSAEPGDEKLKRCTQHAMDLSVVEKNSSQKRAVVVFPAQYLPRLINFFDQASRAQKSWAGNHALHIMVRETYEFPVARLQGDLLELFRLLSGVGKVEIEGANLLPGYKEGLMADMMAEEFTAEGFLKSVTGMADRADEARDAKEWTLAAQLAQSIIIALTYAYLTRAEVLHSQPEAFTRAIQHLRWRCELLHGNSLLALHQQESGTDAWLTNSSSDEKRDLAKDLLAAETSVSQALSLATDSPNPVANPWFQSLPVELIPPNRKEWFTDEERGLSWYACGLTHMALGECLFAAGDLERACELYPSGEGFEKAFEKAREGIDWYVKPGMGMKKAVRLARG
jgi:hypothetical protein